MLKGAVSPCKLVLANASMILLTRQHLAAAMLFILTLVGCKGGDSPSDSLEVAVRGLHTAALTNDGKYAVIGSINHGGSYWQLDSKERLYNWNHSDQEATTLIASDLADDAPFGLTAGPHKMVLWNTDTGKYHRYWSAPAAILDLALSADARVALLGLDDGSAVLFDIQRGGIVRRLEHGNRVRSVALSQDRKLALTGSEDSRARLWDLSTGKEIMTIQHDDDVQHVNLSDDGQLAFSVSKYDKAVLWHSRSGHIHGELPIKAQGLKLGIRYTTSAFNHDASLLLTGRTDQTVELWDVETLKKRQSWKLPKRHRWKPTGAAILALSFSEDANTVVAIASNGFIHHLPVRQE